VTAGMSFSWSVVWSLQVQRPLRYSHMRPNKEALSAWRAMLEVHERLTAHMDAQLRAEHGLPL